MKRFEITFEYSDSTNNWEWSTQKCSLCADNEYLAKKKCIELYGLGIDCDYKIISIKEM